MPSMCCLLIVSDPKATFPLEHPEAGQCLSRVIYCQRVADKKSLVLSGAVVLEPVIEAGCAAYLQSQDLGDGGRSTRSIKPTWTTLL